MGICSTHTRVVVYHIAKRFRSKPESWSVLIWAHTVISRRENSPLACKELMHVKDTRTSAMHCVTQVVAKHNTMMKMKTDYVRVHP